MAFLGSTDASLALTSTDFGSSALGGLSSPVERRRSLNDLLPPDENAAKPPPPLENALKALPAEAGAVWAGAAATGGNALLNVAPGIEAAPKVGWAELAFGGVEAGVPGVAARAKADTGLDSGGLGAKKGESLGNSPKIPEAGLTNAEGVVCKLLKAPVEGPGVELEKKDEVVTFG